MMLRGLMTGMALVISVPAFAQVPPELLNNTRRQNGESITACFDTTATTLEFDREVAKLIADSLFVDLQTRDGFGGFPIDGAGFMDIHVAAVGGDDAFIRAEDAVDHGGICLGAADEEFHLCLRRGACFSDAFAGGVRDVI